ncbi:AP2 domain-containing protein [Escherichia coli]|uniref:AP2 domain-containing protein n=1 Tax=Escherichia coli TaxID=562 RepID=UPI00374D1EA4
MGTIATKSKKAARIESALLNKLALMGQKTFARAMGVPEYQVNRISNLRLVTHSENMQNRKIQKNNKSGYRGVSWDAKYGKWRARINASGKCINLGYHDTAELAAAAFEAAKMKYHTV